MEINFSSNKLEKILNDEKEISKYYGLMSKKIEHILFYINAANSLNDIASNKTLKFHKLYGNYINCYAIWINGNYRMIIRPINVNETDLFNINVICIVDIVDYH